MQNSAEIIDLDHFRQQKNQASTDTPEGFTPVLMWYPVWVFVPSQQPAPTT